MTVPACMVESRLALVGFFVRLCCRPYWIRRKGHEHLPGDKDGRHVFVFLLIEKKGKAGETPAPCLGYLFSQQPGYFHYILVAPACQVNHQDVAFGQLRCYFDRVGDAVGGFQGGDYSFRFT